MKHRYIMLTTAMLSPVIIIFFLFHFSSRPNERNNGFTRVFSNNTVSKLSEVPATGLFNRVIGFANDRIFFNSMKPFLFYNTNYGLSKPIINAALYDTIPYLTSSFSVFLIYSDIYIAAGNVPAVMQQNLSGDSMKRISVSSRYTRCALISPSTMVIRTFDTSKSNRVFRKIELSTQKILSENAITERFNDGGFVSDGQLLYDRASSKLFYVYYYSNRFLCMDTNLQLKYRSHTIDTNKTRRFPVASDLAHQSFTPSIPLRFVNLSAYAANGKLYILSGLRADNEKTMQFDATSTIDVYNALTGGYLLSLRIPRPQGQKLKSFAVKGDLIVAIYDKKIITYKLEDTSL